MRTIVPFDPDTLSYEDKNSLKERILGNIIPGDGTLSINHNTDACWIYQGKWEDGKGYKKMRVAKRHQYVHRVSYSLWKGRIPDGLVLDHECRNRGCCNPKHLKPMTVKDNTLLGNGKWIFERGYTPK